MPWPGLLFLVLLVLGVVVWLTWRRRQQEKGERPE
jgi:hypothetical protein